jgi:hypothetical protein
MHRSARATVIRIHKSNLSRRKIEKGSEKEVGMYKTVGALFLATVASFKSSARSTERN